jgi:hypothetical protein
MRLRTSFKEFELEMPMNSFTYNIFLGHDITISQYLGKSFKAYTDPGSPQGCLTLPVYYHISDYR